MKTLYNNKNYIFSISIKVLYLFIFLSCFFYIIVQKQVTDNLSDKLSDILSDSYKNNQTDIKTKVFSIENNILLKYYNSSLNDKTEHEDKTVKYNNLLYILNIYFIVFFLVISIIIYYVSKFVFHKDIPIGQIIIFNLILYILVGIIEYTFFIQIASKYIPVTNEDLLKNIKDYFLK